MRWTTQVTIDSETDSPSAVGEFLRGKFFDQSTGKFGCYSTFDLNQDVEPLMMEKEEYFEPPAHNDYTEWNCAKWGEIKMRWCWEGDGTLQFIFPDGSILENNDCKSDYDWYWYD